MEIARWCQSKALIYTHVLNRGGKESSVLPKVESLKDCNAVIYRGLISGYTAIRAVFVEKKSRICRG